MVSDLILQPVASMPPTATSGWVYVLKLQDNCRYVGYSADPETRIACHFLGRGARWTQIHPPVAVESLQPGNTKLEDVITIALMVQYGFQNVRGGQYVMVDLPAPPPPIVSARSIKPTPPAAVVAVAETSTLLGHVVQVTQRMKEGDTAWMARVAGEKALKCCPSKGFKTFYAPNETLLRDNVACWLEEA